MSAGPIPAVHDQSIWDGDWNHTPAGHYAFDEGDKNILFGCPCGCGRLRSVETARWHWNGNKEKPTLSPSIQVMSECKWHGFLTDGVFTTV